MEIPAATYEAVQRMIDSGETPPGITITEPPAIYRGSIDDLLVPGGEVAAEGPRFPTRPFTPYELEKLKGSLPILGFPYYRLVTQEGRVEGLVYSFRRMEILRSVKIRKNGAKVTQIYHPALRAGIWVSSAEVIAGRWPRGLFPANYQALTPVQVVEEMDKLTGGRDRWRSLTPVGQPAYVLTDQGRVYRVLPLRNGRHANPSTGEPIPYEIKPYTVNGQPQFGFPPVEIDPEVVVGVPRLYLRKLYKLIWGVGADPRIAARAHGTDPYNPHLDLNETFRERPRGRPLRQTQSRDEDGRFLPDGGEAPPPGGWSEDESVST